MTQIKGTFEGCGEAPAPLKLNEVFISRADSTLNTARSRAVTVNVSLQSTGCLFSLANGPERTKGHTFFTLFFMHFPRPVSPILTPGFPLVCFLFFFFFLPPARSLLATEPPFPVFPAGESLYIVVSAWIWKPHGEVNIREV